MAPYEVKNEQFKGPLEKLLELIEEKKLEITQLSLADVTADFLNYIKTLEGEAFAQQSMADFLVVASRLILIKSKALLPSLQLTAEEETDIKSLEIRLKLYHELKATHQMIRSTWDETSQMFSREFLMTTEPIFYPPANMGPEFLRDTLARMVGELEKVFRPTATVRREILHLKQKIEEVLARLTELPTQFNALQKGKGREEIVVLFLAVLHLIKDQFVHAVQDAQFGAITIAKKSPVT
ncbi:MAG: segregation/condensation protein A [Patescibacteria group bacterium]